LRRTTANINSSRLLWAAACVLVIALLMVIIGSASQGITMLAFGCALLFLLLLLLIGGRIQQLLKSEHKRLEAMVEARTQALSDLASHLTQAREAERQRIARELHDQMGAWLTAANLDAQHLKRAPLLAKDPDLTARLDRLTDSIGRTIKLGRRLVDELHPPLLQGLGLVEALRVLAEDFELDVPVRLALPEQMPHLHHSQSLALYRIAQESLTNVRKYARADQVTLRLWVDDSTVHLSVEDDGVGFHLNEACNQGHGIAGMRHRTQMFKGELRVCTTKGQGTRIEAQMPLMTQQQAMAA
jgi:signal transduction histidine kinase